MSDTTHDLLYQVLNRQFIMFRMLKQILTEGRKMSAEVEALTTEVSRMVSEVSLAVAKIKALADAIVDAGTDHVTIADLTAKLHGAADALDAAVNPAPVVPVVVGTGDVIV